jgi:hypothetical protein
MVRKFPGKHYAQKNQLFHGLLRTEHSPVCETNPPASVPAPIRALCVLDIVHTSMDVLLFAKGASSYFPSNERMVDGQKVSR